MILFHHEIQPLKAVVVFNGQQHWMYINLESHTKELFLRGIIIFFRLMYVVYLHYNLHSDFSQYIYLLICKWMYHINAFYYIQLVASLCIKKSRLMKYLVCFYIVTYISLSISEKKIFSIKSSYCNFKVHFFCIQTLTYVNEFKAFFLSGP